MAKEPQINESSFNQFVGGLHTDQSPIDQPKGTWRFALNAVIETIRGDQRKLSNEQAHAISDKFKSGFFPIGYIYMQDDEVALILVNPTEGKEEIGVISKDNKYTTHVDTRVLNLFITYQCQLEFRVRRGNEKVVYWVDGNNNARLYNFTRPYNFYNNTYINYLKAGGDPNTYVGEKWDAASFELIKTYEKIPFFSNVEILETGAITPGSYNFAVQYVDEDLNPTEWINVSNTVNIFNDTLNQPFHKIRGSRNIDTTSQSFPKANKSIKITMTNLDDSFPYYRIAIIQGTSMEGIANKALVSDIYSTGDSTFLYTGNDGNLTETSLADILIDKEIIFAPNHISQIENRLILAKTKGRGVNWCDFQPYASKIKSDLKTKETILNSVASEANVKNAKSTFFFRGYMPGEVYSFGIVYIFKDGYISPAFHIPGKSTFNTSSQMKVHEINNKYLDIHNCAANNYWGVDSEGHTLAGKKIRHHRFPFRKEVNKPLFTRTGNSTVINQNVLALTFTLNPAWVSPTSGPNFFPTDINGDPLTIDAGVQYKLSTQPSNDSFGSQLTDTDISIPIQIYAGITGLDVIDTPRHFIIDPTSELGSYQDPSGSNYYLVPRFIITESYTTVPLTTVSNTDTSEIFGIEFSNIERPHPDVVGFYIVRNERQEDDKMIVDNALFGSMIANQDYRSFGLITPKQFVSGRQLDYYNKGVWFFSPEFQYFWKKADFSSVEIEGKYTEDSMDLPTYTHGPSSGRTYGLYIDDVQAGTSYNPEVNKRKNRDDDGFDLMVGYKNINVNYTSLNNASFPNKTDVLNLTAAAYQNKGSEIFYNVSVDNKISMLLSDGTFDMSMFRNSGTDKNSFIYGSLTRGGTSTYSNFMTRAYYKEHNNPVMFGSNNVVNGVEIFNGDAQISSFNFVSSVFYDMVVAEREKKSKVWKIIVGAVLIVVGVVLTIYGVGIGLTAAGAALLAGLAVSYGVSLAMNGIKFEQFKKMVDVDYEKGLRETVTDRQVEYTVGNWKDRSDDTIRWFSDRLSNVYLETSVPFGLRSGLTCGVTDFVDAPTQFDENEFRSYLTEKLTVLDRDQGSGRLYKGYATTEVYDMNKDFMRFNKEKEFFHLPIEYDCCSDKEEDQPTRVWNSEQSFQEEKTDNFRSFLPNNYRDIEGIHGEITNLYRLGNALYIHTKEALWHLPQNIQERATSEIVSFIGTGDFFSILPRKVVDDKMGSAGTQHKWASIKTKNGVFFVNEVEHSVYLHADKLTDLSLYGERNWFMQNLRSYLKQQLFEKFKVEFPWANNPANPNGTGYHAAYDKRYERILLTKRDYLILPERLEELILVNERPINGNNFCYSLADGCFYSGALKINLDDPDYFENKSFTKSFSFHINRWISYHSYLPLFMISSQNSVYSTYGTPELYRHNIENLFQTFQGIRKPFIVDLVVSHPVDDKTFEDFSFMTEAMIYDPVSKGFVDSPYITFNRLIAYNNRQSTNWQDIVPKRLMQASSWYNNQTKNNVGEIIATKNLNQWNVNRFRDRVINYEYPIFSMDWNHVKDEYYIDKVINPLAFQGTKPWTDFSMLKGKFIVVRLKFDNFDNVNLLLNYTQQTEQSLSGL